jgi:hypothetical protein
MLVNTNLTINEIVLPVEYVVATAKHVASLAQ